MKNPLPSDELQKLTEKQFDLLVWVYVAGYRTAADIHITWSPKAFLKRSPTKAEAATLSKRMKTLVERGLLTHHKRELSITDTGKLLLASYASDLVGHPVYDGLLARIEFDNAVFGLGLSTQLMPTLITVYRDELGLEHSEAVEAARKLHAGLARHSLKQASKALEQLRNAQNKTFSLPKTEPQ